MELNDFISKEEIQKDLDKKATGGDFSDSRFWRIPDGKSKIRLLPRLEAKVPWKTVYSHRYNKSGEKLFSTCMLTFGKKGCPICKKSWSMYESEDKQVKDLGYQVRKTPRYMFNCYIVDDPKTPENNGQVRIISIGKKLFDLILESYNSEDLGKVIFDATNGFDFEINRKQSGDNPNYPDYSSSRFVFKRNGVVKSWDAIKDKLINIDDLIKEETPEELVVKWKFLGFEGVVTTPPKQDGWIGGTSQGMPGQQQPVKTKQEKIAEEDEINIDELAGGDDTDEGIGKETLTDDGDEIELDGDIEDELSKL